METKLGKVGLIGRFKPLHIGGAALLEGVCENADNVLIGIGSSDKYNLRNPFTAKESEEMIRSVLSPRFSNFEIIYLPDFGHIPEFNNGEKWRDYVVEKFGELDLFVSGNEYVRKLFDGIYELAYPHEFVPIERRIKLRSTEVRIEIARFGEWKKLVPEPVAEYLENNKLIDRFRKEFGLATIASFYENENYSENENLAEEKAHAGEI